jgi:hypothetical protein
LREPLCGIGLVIRNAPDQKRAGISALGGSQCIRLLHLVVGLFMQGNAVRKKEKLVVCPTLLKRNQIPVGNLVCL